MSVERAFEIPSIVVNDRAGILSGDADPTVPGLNAPLSTLYMRSDGTHWRKTGVLDTDWTLTDQGGGSSSGFSGLGIWRYRTATSNDPSAGQIQFNNVTVDLATAMYINVTNDGGTDMTNFLALLTSGDMLYMQVSNDADKFATVQVDNGSLAAGVYTFPLLQVESQGAAVTNNTQAAIVAVHSGGPKELQFINRAGASANIAIISTPTYQLPFFNRAGSPENIGII